MTAGVRSILNSTDFSSAPKVNHRAWALRDGPEAWLEHHPRPGYPSTSTPDAPHSFPLYLVATTVLRDCQPNLGWGLPQEAQ